MVNVHALVASLISDEARVTAFYRTPCHLLSMNALLSWVHQSIKLCIEKKNRSDLGG